MRFDFHFPCISRQPNRFRIKDLDLALFLFFSGRIV
uniref:Uncharacterized protein n=1 Tax=Rhizophora mucronata TaxID=61149 RepID=A0A2P2P8U2_RHIMU